MSARDDVSSYVLGELDGAERAAFEAAMARDPALRAEVERLQPVVTRLDALEPGAWEPGRPPPLVPPFGAASVPPSPGEAREPGAASASAPAGRRLRIARRPIVLRPAAAALAALLLLATGLGAGLVLGGSDGAAPDGAARVVALAPVEPLGGSAGGEARLAGAGGTATVRVTGLPPSRGGRFYELWLLGAEGELVSLGSFRVPASGEADLSVPLPADPSRFAALDVSVEPADGDPGHSKQSVLRAPLPSA